MHFLVKSRFPLGKEGAAYGHDKRKKFMEEISKSNYEQVQHRLEKGMVQFIK